jgi:hypothetical protein
MIKCFDIVDNTLFVTINIKDEIPFSILDFNLAGCGVKFRRNLSGCERIYLRKKNGKEEIPDMTVFHWDGLYRLRFVPGFEDIFKGMNFYTHTKRYHFCVYYLLKVRFAKKF